MTGLSSSVTFEIGFGLWLRLGFMFRLSVREGGPNGYTLRPTGGQDTLRGILGVSHVLLTTSLVASGSSRTGKGLF